MATTVRRALANRLAADATRIQAALRWVLRAALLLVAVTIIGTLGYMLLMGWNLLDALYMTVLTIGTVGYEEVHDLSNDPAGRLWTIVLIIGGVGSLAYAASTIGEFIIEGTVRGYFQRRRMGVQKPQSTSSADITYCAATGGLDERSLMSSHPRTLTS